MAKATYETVVAAIEQLKSEGRSTTIAAIQAITGGSNSTIVTLKQRYNTERPTVTASRTINVNPVISEMIAAEIEKAAAEAGAEAGQRRSEIEADMLRLAEEAEATAAALEAAQEQNVQILAQLQQLNGTIEQLKSDAVAVKTDAEKQIAAEQLRARDAVTKAEAESARERADREATQMELAKASLRLESLPKLEAEIQQVRQALDLEREARSVAEAKAAGADAKAAGLADRLTDAQAAAATEAKAASGRLADVQADAEKAAVVAEARLSEQSRSCAELTNALRSEVKSWQQKLAESEAAKQAEKPMAE